MPDNTPDSPSVPQVEIKATKPPGLLPRNTQARLLAGIAVLMVIVIIFSGRNPPKERSATPLKPPAPVDPNEARIKEYRLRIEEQVKKLAAEQAQIAQTKKAAELSSASEVGTSLESRQRAIDQYSSVPARVPVPEKTWLQEEREKRDYQSRFASNMVLSYRPEVPQSTRFLRTPTPNRSSSADPQGPLWPIPPSWPASYGPSPSAATSAPEKAPASRGSTSSGNAEDEREEAQNTSKKTYDDLNQAEGKTYRVFEGTILEAVLTNRLDGSFSGPVNCMTTTDVYSHSGQRLLIPQGSRVLGQVRRVTSFGQQRLAVVFHRLIMPDGYSVSLEKFQGLNQIGETGLRDKVNHHYLQVFGVSFAIGAIAGLGQANANYGLDADGLDVYRQGVAASLSQSSLRILDRYLNVLPTFTIREGHRVKIYLSEDVLLPAYDMHRMPDNL